MMLLISVLVPMLGAAGLFIWRPKCRKACHVWTFAWTLLTSLCVLAALLNSGRQAITLLPLTTNLTISFKLDGLGRLFSGMVAILWPLATLYAFEYMEHAERQKAFFMFFTMTYGVTLGIAFASDMLTLYFFYELLTLVTVPLVMHNMNRESILAVRRYLYYSLGGAAFALMGMIFLIIYGNTLKFTLGGVLDASLLQEHRSMMLWLYFFSFMGFGVKAAIFPVSSWLPQAGVAPTPVTALLHAVAVVNAGAFGIIRLTYYSFGTDLLRGTWVQTACMAVTMFTIVYGCSRAVKETHIKRRLAWSTVSNLSYILFGATIMTPLGMVGALAHFVFHGFMKITSFLCAGAFMHQTGKTHVYHMNGMGRKMKVIFGTFTVSALGLMGVPGLAGFISKWNLTAAAVESGNVLAYGGIVCLLVSALLTAIYMLSVVIRAFFPHAEAEPAAVSEAGDPSWRMCVPLLICAAFVIAFGFCSGPLIDFFRAVALGLE